jgi:hypothetical protein
MQKRAIVIGSMLAVAGFLAFEPDAEARLVIKNPDDHPDYRAELEPHGNLILWRRYYGRRYRRYNTFGDPDFGAGFRATIEIADPAFIPKLNNTVGISFGIDFTSCRFCREDFTAWFPIAMQWNFFLTDKWSVFAELGIIPRVDAFDFGEYLYLDPLFELGGRYHFNDTVALTMRIGYPFISVGASFFIGG